MIPFKTGDQVVSKYFKGTGVYICDDGTYAKVETEDGVESVWKGSLQLSLPSFPTLEPIEVIKQSVVPQESPQNALQGSKYDKDKLRFDILPAEALIEIIKVVTYGENKYPSLMGEDGKLILNWKKLDNAQERFFSAGQRHIYADRLGEDTDDESGLWHLAHACSNLIFKLQLKIEEQNRKDKNDNPKS